MCDKQMNINVKKLLIEKFKKKTTEGVHKEA